ncbi:MAG: LysR family transcriptional regulator [Clostridia bacterium]|nr:LysR family transcriptional regulator [Clostridia bacterium]
MNTMHLKYAIEIERTGSISKAAENLFMAQPNLSKAIKEMEQNFNITIFERTPRGVIPTARGREFLESAKVILSQVDKMKEISNEYGDREVVKAKISIPRGSYISKAFAKTVASLDPETALNIQIRETNSMQTILNVSENSYDFGIIRYQTVNERYFLDYLKKKKLEYKELWEFPCLVVMNTRNKHINDEQLSLKELAQDGIEVIHGDNIIPYISKNNLDHNEFTHTAEKKVYLYERGSQFQLLVTVDNAYMWASPLPESIVKTLNLVQRRCDAPNNAFKDGIIWRKDYVLSPVDLKFIQNLKEEIKDLQAIEYK